MRNTTFLIAVVVLGSLLFCLWSVFIYPFWPFWFTSRPMFSHWVGASHTAWGRDIFFHDSDGTWLFIDDEFNIVVMIQTLHSGSEIPLLKASATQATFQIEAGQTTVQSFPHNRLVVITKNGQSHEFPLNPNGGKTMRDKLVNAMSRENGQPPELIHDVVEYYNGERLGELRDLLKPVINPAGRR
jgi:hypothetical protein